MTTLQDFLTHEHLRYAFHDDNSFLLYTQEPIPQDMFKRLNKNIYLPYMKKGEFAHRLTTKQKHTLFSYCLKEYPDAALTKSHPDYDLFVNFCEKKQYTKNLFLMGAWDNLDLTEQKVIDFLKNCSLRCLVKNNGFHHIHDAVFLIKGNIESHSFLTDENILFDAGWWLNLLNHLGCTFDKKYQKLTTELAHIDKNQHIMLQLYHYGYKKIWTMLETRLLADIEHSLQPDPLYQEIPLALKLPIFYHMCDLYHTDVSADVLLKNTAVLFPEAHDLPIDISTLKNNVIDIAHHIEKALHEKLFGYNMTRQETKEQWNNMGITIAINNKTFASEFLFPSHTQHETELLMS